MALTCVVAANLASLRVYGQATAALLLTRPRRDAFQSHLRRVSPLMLWTILIILAIIALVLFILGFRRSRV